MKPSDVNILHILLMFVVLYAYTARLFWNEPDPSTEFGISMNAMMAGILAATASIVTFAIVVAVGVWGYLISLVLAFIVIRKIVKKMVEPNAAMTP